MIRPIRIRRTHLFYALAVTVALIGAVGFFIGRMTSIQNPETDVRISGHSMAPALLGPHFNITCGDCGIVYACAEPFVSPEDPLVCPNCGYDKQSLGHELPQPGDRVRVRASDTIGRWDLVTFQSTAVGRGAVKRVVGLPGERVGIVGGDLYIDDRIVRKSFDELRDVAVLVHDDRFRPRRLSELPQRWHPCRDDSNWKTEAHGHSASALERVESDWLAYDHWACIAGASPSRERTQSSMVYDHYAYNQTVSRGPLNVQRDLMVTLEFDWSGPGTLSIGFDRAVPLRIVLDASRNVVQVEREGNVRMETRFRGSLTGRHELEAAVCDQRVLVAVDRQPCVEWSIDESPTDRTASDGLPRIGIARAKIEIHSIRIHRDLYLMGPDPGSSEWQAAEPLSGDELFVLGDNVPVSEDSRNWLGPVDRNLLLGKVLRVRRPE